MIKMHLYFCLFCTHIEITWGTLRFWCLGLTPKYCDWYGLGHRLGLGSFASFLSGTKVQLRLRITLYTQCTGNAASEWKFGQVPDSLATLRHRAFGSLLCKTQSQLSSSTLQSHKYQVSEFLYLTELWSSPFPSSHKWGQWRGGSGPAPCPLLFLLTCPTLVSAFMKVKVGNKGGMGWGEMSQHRSHVAGTLLWASGPWLQVRSLLGRQILSSLFPKRSSTLVSQRFPQWDTSPPKFSWFWTPSTVTLCPAVTPASCSGGFLTSM